MYKRQELECAMPNLTVKYDKDITSEEFAKLCASTALVTAKPSFANHRCVSETANN